MPNGIDLGPTVFTQWRTQQGRWVFYCLETYKMSNTRRSLIREKASDTHTAGRPKERSAVGSAWGGVGWGSPSRKGGSGVSPSRKF